MMPFSTPAIPQKSAIHQKPVTAPRAAFTLVEMLVVIAILAILVVLAFPALRQARVSGQVAESASNLRQIYNGVQLSVTENNWNYPLAQRITPPETVASDYDRANTQWSEAAGRLLYPEIRRSLPAGFPWMWSDVRGHPTGYSNTVFRTPALEPDASMRIASYGYNEMLTQPDQSVRRFGQMFDAAKTGLIADNSGRTHSLRPTSANARINARYGASQPHASDGRATAVYLDGHVEVLTAQQVREINDNPAHPFWGVRVSQ